MKASDIPEFTRVLTSVSILYGKTMSKPLVELYWAALQAFALAEVKQALQAHVQHPDVGQYMPKPADVVRAVQGDSHTRALQAWSQVTQAMRSVGVYSSVIFDDPLIHAVVSDVGGWIALNQIVDRDLPFRERDFIARYVGFVNKPPTHYPRELRGLFARQNSIQGYAAEPPVCIGDPQKALQVYQQGEISARPSARLPFDPGAVKANLQEVTA